MTTEVPFTVASVGYDKARTGLRSLGFRFTLRLEGIEGEYSRFQALPMTSDDPDREPLGVVIAKEIAPVIGMTPKAILKGLQKQDKALLKKLAEKLHGDAVVTIEERTDVGSGEKRTDVSVGRLYWGDNNATAEDTASVGNAIDKWL